MKHIFRIIILFLALLLTSMVYVFGLLYDKQNQIDMVKMRFELLKKELEDHKNHPSDINYDDEILDIHNKIEDLHKPEEQQSVEPIVEKIEPKNEKTTSGNKQDKPGKTEKDSSYSNDIYEDIKDEYYGRLYIPDLNINVALYYGSKQYITDRIDSANIYIGGYDEGFTIADHNNQEFAKLLNVQAGMTGYIDREIGRVNIKCVDVFSGYNTGYDIIDESGANAANRTDYMMYTCKSSSKNVLICLWEIV